MGGKGLIGQACNLRKPKGEMGNVAVLFCFFSFSFISLVQSGRVADNTLPHSASRQ